MDLIIYDRAKTALAEASRIDEVKGIRNKAKAMEEYARQAKDTELIRHATGIRLRAERRAGELLREMPKAAGARGTGRNQYEVASPIDEPTSPLPTLADIGISHNQSSKWQKLAALPNEEFEAKVELAEERAANATTSAPRNERSEFSGDTEWYTPAEYIEKARAVLGDFDVDPASNDIAQETVRAAEFFTAADNGLDQEWNGRVWLNPPYRQPLIAHFVDKLISERKSGRTTEAIMLTNNSADTAWFQKAARAADAMCFTAGRISFVSPSKETTSPTSGQTFFYFGENAEAFSEEFQDVGLIAEERRARGVARAAVLRAA